MANTVQLKKNGQIVYPITDRACVIGLNEGPLMEFIYAWDGSGTPVPANIPAGVTVTYDGNTYTGTLAASASTSGYIYLVYNPTSTEYDRYGTDATGGSYAWKAMGDTTIQSPDIADNLTTNDSTKALSAKQGKILNEEVEGLEAKIEGEVSAFQLANGSQGNPGNAWVVTLRGTATLAIPVTPGHRYKLQINKAAESGFNFYWRIITYSTDSPTSLTSNVKRNEVNSWDEYYENGDTVEILANEYGLTIQLTELTQAGASQSASTCVALRAADFVDGDLEVIDVTGSVKQEIKELNSRETTSENKIASIETSEWNNSFVGNANVFVSTRINGLVPGRRYKIVLQDANYDRTGVTVTSAYVFAVVNYDSNGNSETITGATATETVKPYYTFTVPTDSAYFKIGGRAAVGTKVLFNIYDITDIDVEKQVEFRPYNTTNNDVIMYCEGTKLQSAPVYIRFETTRVTKNGSSFTFTNSVVASDLGITSATSPCGMENSMEIPHGKNLLYNSATNKFSLKDNTSEIIGDEVLVISVADGRIVKYGDAMVGDIVQMENSISKGLISAFVGKVFDLRNGSPGNPGNTSYVSSSIIPYPGKSTCLVKTNRPNTPGFRYVYGFSIAQSYHDVGHFAYNGSGVGTIISLRDVSKTAFNNTEEIPSSRREWAGIMVCIGESNGTELHPLRVGDFAGYDVRVSFDGEPVIERNQDKLPMLINSCRYRKNGSTSKDFQVLVCTDSHGDTKANKNAVLATNGFVSIDAYIHCGDIVGSNYAEPSSIADFQAKLNMLTKPGYVVIGNHDVGNAFYVGVSCDHAQAYDAYIKPMVDNGWLAAGEYEANKPYWFHDNTSFKIRIIGLYEYDDNLDFNETYWKAIPYDSSLDAIAFNTAYQVGAKVNAGVYTGHSFECVQAVTTPVNYYTNAEKLPSYKVQRGSRVIRQTQAQWFLDTLASTPAGYGVIVLTHNPFSDTAVSMDKKFSWPAGVSGASWTQTSMATNFIKNALAAFKAVSSYNEKVVMAGSAAYLNVLNDGSIDYAYAVSKDFSSLNTGVHLLGLIGGHAHRDLIWQDGDIYQISPNCARVDGANDRNGDVRRTWTDDVASDSLTVVSMAEGRIGLVKIGVNVTERGTFRDYEVLDTTE